jgi:hypothetical protein
MPVLTSPEADPWSDFEFIICPYCLEWRVARLRLWMAVGPLWNRPGPPPTWFWWGAKPLPGSGRKVTFDAA